MNILFLYLLIYLLYSGGPSIVCSRWDQEVRETRHKIMAAARLVTNNKIKHCVNVNVVQIFDQERHHVCGRERCRNTYLENCLLSGKISV